MNAEYVDGFLSRWLRSSVAIQKLKLGLILVVEKERKKDEEENERGRDRRRRLWAANLKCFFFFEIFKSDKISKKNLVWLTDDTGAPVGVVVTKRHSVNMSKAKSTPVTVCICYSVGLWFSKIYRYNRCIITSDVHSLRSNHEPLFPARTYPWKIYKIPNPTGYRVVFSIGSLSIHRSFFLLWLTNEKVNLERGKLRNVECWLAQLSL